MSRDDGFARADISVRLMRDRKFKRLEGLLRPGQAHAAMLLYLATVLDSWAEGDRIPVDEADGPVAASPLLVQALQRVRLLDDEGRIPEHAWESWFAPAQERRQARVKAGRLGGLAKARNRAGEAVAGLQPSHSVAAASLYPAIQPTSQPDQPTSQPASETDGSDIYATRCVLCDGSITDDLEETRSIPWRGVHALVHKACAPAPKPVGAH
jgi:hypothetical protein